MGREGAPRSPRRIGNEFLFETLAKKTLRTWPVRVKKVYRVSSLLQHFQERYPHMALFEVITTAALARLVDEGKPSLWRS